MAKGGGGSAPAAPDPKVVAQEQGAANADTARLTAQLNRINQFGPNGSVTYTRGNPGAQAGGAPQGMSPRRPDDTNGSTPATGAWVPGFEGENGTQMVWNPDAPSAPGQQPGGTSTAADKPTSGFNYDPNDTWTQTTTLSPDQQKLYDQQAGISQALYGLGAKNLTAIEAAQSKPFDISGAPKAVNNLNFSSLPGLQSGVTPGALTSSIDPASLSQTFGNTAQGIQYDIADAGSIQRALADFGRAQSGISNTLGNQTGTFADTGQQQRNFADVGGPQSALDFSGATALPGNGDFSADRQAVQDALYRRQTATLDPRFAQERSRYEQSLAERGIPVNSEAYNKALTSFDQRRNAAYQDALDSSILAGGNEQSRLFGQALAARQQGVGETTTQGNFANSAQQQAYAQALGRGQFTNQAQAEDYSQALGRGNFANQAQATDFGQAAARTAQFNAALGQDQGYEATRGAFANNAQAQQFGQNAAQQAARNAAQQQDFGQLQSRADFGNQAALAQQQADTAAAQFGNDAQQIAFGQGLSNAQLGNSARAQGVNEQGADAALQNAGRQNYIQEQAYLRGLPINELATLLGTSGGVQGPQFGSVPQVGVAPTDVSAGYQMQQNAAIAAQNQATAANGQLGGLLGTAATAAAVYF